MNDQYNTEKLLKELPHLACGYDSKTDTLIYSVPDTFVCERGFLHVSGETGQMLIDYYGEFNNGYAYIAPKLIEWASKQGLMWEWDNPGSICLFE